jgi:sigma-B regulation protein RsbU (phosphoserine phosphatase)
LCAGHVGGDFFDYLRLANDRVGIVVGDVTGHGLGPALLMAATRAYLRAFAQTQTNIGRILTLANRLLIEDLADGRNVTLLLAQVDPSSRSLIHTSAGHPPGFVIGPAGRIRARLYSTGLPLGIERDGDYPPEPVIGLEPGDVILFFTDGLIEAPAPGGERFGSDRALDILIANRMRTAREIVAELFQEVDRFSPDPRQRDDITLIVIKVLTASTGLARV